MRPDLKIRLLNQRELERDFKRLAKEAGLEGRHLADEAAEVGVRALIRNTQPFGLGGKARREGERAVARGVNRVFQVVDDAAGGDVIRTLAQAEAHHRSQRRRGTGRVSRRAVRRPILRAVYRRYMDRQIGKVGTAKGAWADGARRLGLRAVQKWITRHDDGGDARRSGKRGRVTWTLSAGPPHVASGHVLGERGARRVLAAQERNLRRMFEGRLRRRMREAERRLNG